jgi:hypothetical protein
MQLVAGCCFMCFRNNLIKDIDFLELLSSTCQPEFSDNNLTQPTSERYIIHNFFYSKKSDKIICCMGNNKKSGACMTYQRSAKFKTVEPFKPISFRS